MGIFSLFRRNDQKNDRHPMAVRFDPKQVTPEIEAEIRRYFKDDPRISWRMRRKVIALAIQSVRRGRDLKHLSDGLHSLGFAKGQAAEFSLSLNNRCTALIRFSRETKLVVTHGIWLWSSIPCFMTGEAGYVIRDGYEELSEAHRNANKKEFSLRDGLMINGTPSWPGVEAGCKCIHRAFLPSFDR